jgi:O-antigen ligase
MPAVFGLGILIFLKNARLGIVLAILGGSYLLWSNFGEAFFAGETASLMRPYIWLDVLRIGMRSPILGLGPAVYMFHWADPSFSSITFQLSQTYAWNRFNFSPPSHNLFVDVFAQTGIVGTIFFLWLLAAVAAFGWRMYRCFKPGFQSAYVNGVFAGFIAITISSAPFADWLIPFVYNIGIEGFAHSVYSWILLGTLVALDHRPKECLEDAQY